MKVYFGKNSDGGDGSKEHPYNSLDDFQNKHQPNPHEPLEFCFLEEAEFTFLELIGTPSCNSGTFAKPLVFRGYIDRP